MQRSRALLAALGQAIGSDEAISWIDVGMFGQFGEWLQHHPCRYNFTNIFELFVFSVFFVFFVDN